MWLCGDCAELLEDSPHGTGGRFCYPGKGYCYACRDTVGRVEWFGPEDKFRTPLLPPPQHVAEYLNQPKPEEDEDW